MTDKYKCDDCGKTFNTKEARGQHSNDKHGYALSDDDPQTRPDWTAPCDNCEAVPTLPSTGMCGPCTFGEAETADGNW